VSRGRGEGSGGPSLAPAAELASVAAATDLTPASVQTVSGRSFPMAASVHGSRGHDGRCAWTVEVSTEEQGKEGGGSTTTTTPPPRHRRRSRAEPGRISGHSAFADPREGGGGGRRRLAPARRPRGGGCGSWAGFPCSSKPPAAPANSRRKLRLRRARVRPKARGSWGRRHRDRGGPSRSLSHPISGGKPDAFHMCART
jgi:hypothetical protein